MHFIERPSLWANNWDLLATQTCGGRAFDIYKAKMMKDELKILRSLIAVQSSTGQTTFFNYMIRVGNSRARVTTNVDRYDCDVLMDN